MKDRPWERTLHTIAKRLAYSPIANGHRSSRGSRNCYPGMFHHIARQQRSVPQSVLQSAPRSMDYAWDSALAEASVECSAQHSETEMAIQTGLSSAVQKGSAMAIGWDSPRERALRQSQRTKCRHHSLRQQDRRLRQRYSTVDRLLLRSALRRYPTRTVSAQRLAPSMEYLMDCSWDLQTAHATATATVRVSGSWKGTLTAW